MRGSREISLVPSLHRASTDALITRQRNDFRFMATIIDKSFQQPVAVWYCIVGWNLSVELKQPCPDG